ncbi:LAFE_0H00474g1_1 [Lachancea fermentati]|uniref:LAFE_0H00474g1_1 n=1 Tax=Lachancea fermentati TaxID=4955 RepID=A0A1G4MIX1_LACFM|nr:LAFE_0H00474g1_1 [Lachancea fermentati]
MPSSNKKPNFLIIVADDLGFTDLGCFGGEISTPNLDKLASSGIRFTGFHTASACSPTRSMLFSGTDNHLAGLGQMAEFIKFERLGDEFEGKPGYEGYLNYKVAALPEITSPEYYNVISGKWHLGLDEPYWPDKRGFEKSFTLLPGAGNHYKYKFDEKTFMPSIFQENGRRIDAESELPDDFYSTEYYTTKFLEYLKDEDRNGRPFLGALTYTAPHWPLQAPLTTALKYKGVYDKGPIELRNRRLARAAELGIIDKDVVPHLVETKSIPWDELSAEEKKYSSRVMEFYAAMVDELDKNIGRVLKHLEDTGELENTMIFFMSDNGAEGSMLEALPSKTVSFADNVQRLYDNSYDNIGKKDSFVMYGDLWAQAATAPRYMYKAWSTEGGINCPLILSYPKISPKWSPGSITHEFCTVMDILPTVLEFSKISHPGASFKGRTVHKPKGISWAPYLDDKVPEIYDEKRVTGWELFGQRAIRQGRYKALWIPKPIGSGEWELYDILKDPGEINDLKYEQPQVLEGLIEHWTLYVAEAGVIELEQYPEGTRWNVKVIKDS